MLGLTDMEEHREPTTPAWLRPFAEPPPPLYDVGMSYWGKVKPGTPAVRELPELIITKASVGPMDNNAYLLRCRRTDEQVLIDAANEADTLLQLVGDGGLARVITTHQHGDHWQALGDVVQATSAETIAGADDVDGIPARSTDRSTTATRFRSAPAPCRSSTSSGTPPDLSPCCTTTQRGRHTSSPETAFSLGALAG